MNRSAEQAAQAAKLAELKRLITTETFESLEQLEEAVDAFLWSEEGAEAKNGARPADAAWKQPSFQS